MYKTLTILSLAAGLSVAATAPTLARDDGEDVGGGQQAWGTSSDQNPENFPDCMVWSGRDRTYVWICGPPYPPNMPHR